jgi:hypothetical protein
MGQAIPETAMETAGVVVDRGWGDYWLADEGLAPTRVTVEQVTVMGELGAVEAGASDVRFGGGTGELLIVTAEGQWWEIAEDGARENVTEVMG